MGMTAENLAERWQISREEQDKYAALSQQKTEKAQENDLFNEEIIPVPIPQKKGSPFTFEKDEYPRKSVTVDSLSDLRPAFKKDGTVTAGNSSGISDGAASLLLMSVKKSEELQLPPLAKIKAFAYSAVEPEIMGYGPVPATKAVLEKAGIGIEDIDLAELNEAFAVQSLVVLKELGLPRDIVNVNGGAIALGHPIGASGARILVTLLYAMRKRNARKGLASLCVGGGMGISLIVEAV